MSEHQTEGDVFARDDKSGWVWQLLKLSNHNFNRLNPDLIGAPMYFNGDRVWPSAAPGISVIRSSTEISLNILPDVRRAGE